MVAMIKKQLKIIYLDFDDIHNPLLGAGQARATCQVAKRLVSKGHSVEVICSKYPGYRSRVESGIKYAHIGLGSKSIRLNNLIYILMLPFAVKKLVADVVVECFTAPISTLFSPLFTNIPVVALSTSFEAERFAKLYHLPFDKIEKFGLRFYKYFLPSSKFFELKISEVNPGIISKVVPQGVDDKYLRIESAKNPKHILFLGRLDIGQKGIDLLLKAYKQIKSSVDYPLVIVGHGPDEKQVRNLVSKYKLEKKVRLTGPIFGNRKEKLLSEAVVFAVPSRNEGFCIAALEAIAAGVPVVCFDIPGLSWIPSRVSLKAKAFNVGSYVQKLTDALGANQNHKLRKECKKVASNYSWDDVTDEYEKFFQFMVEDDRKKTLS